MISLDLGLLLHTAITNLFNRNDRAARERRAMRQPEMSCKASWEPMRTLKSSTFDLTSFWPHSKQLAISPLSSIVVAQWAWAWLWIPEIEFLSVLLVDSRSEATVLVRPNSNAQHMTRTEVNSNPTLFGNSHGLELPILDILLTMHIVRMICGVPATGRYHK